MGTKPEVFFRQIELGPMQNTEKQTNMMMRFASLKDFLAVMSPISL